jgi:uncharacterized protein (TIGR02246 family)
MRKSLSLLSLLLIAACNNGTKAAADSTAMASGDTAKTAMPADDNASKDAIAKLRSAWQDGSNKKDAAGVAALYTDDAALVGTGVPYASGRSEIQTRLGQMFGASAAGTIVSKETMVSGNLAFDEGTYTQTVTPPKGKPMTVNGHYLVTLKKGADGSWKIYRHLSVDSAPNT